MTEASPLEPLGPTATRDVVTRRTSRYIWGTRNFIDEVIESIEREMGAATFQEILATDLRAIQGRKPDALRHRLGYVVHEVRDFSASFKYWHSRLPPLDDRNTLIAELTRYALLLERWRDHSLHQQMCRQLVTESTFYHNMGIWNLAGSAQGFGNGVELLEVSSKSGETMHDMRLFAFGDGTPIQLELKAPQGLQRLPSCLTYATAAAAVEKAWKKAREQIDPATPAILAIYTTGLCNECIALLVRAAFTFLNGAPNVGGRRSLLSGIGFVQHHEVHKRITERDPDPRSYTGLRTRYFEVTNCMWHFADNLQYEGAPPFDPSWPVGELLEATSVISIGES